jgi:acyl carrier protein
MKAMNNDRLTAQLEEVLEMSPGTLREDEQVRALKTWDSLKLLEIIAFADEQLHIQVDADKLFLCDTAGAIVALLKDTTAKKDGEL